ncbi:UDP-3-O-(3-hydroxymyristoyl)glucosamine N-acyltransferase [candidate division WOR-3 bacterium]|nr:UDP-3-O-(3-hydroxymyristoyl)glucosamine N-acyltransferase [candidate division WOR-3 bacterium]
MKLVEIAAIIKGAVYGNSEFEVQGVMPPEQAQPSDLAFLMDSAVATNAGAVVSRQEMPGKSGIVVTDPKEAMYCLLKELAAVEKSSGVSPQSLIEGGVELGDNCTVEPFAVIKKGARVGNNTYIGAQCYIDEGVVIGESCRICPGTVIYKHTQVGDFVVIDSNTVIGKEGFGFVKQARYERIRHIGGVIVGNFVEIGSGVTIDRGTIGNTVIGDGTKIDNQVHIAHNVRIGRDCIIMGQCGIAGSSKIGNNVVLCGQVGISDHLNLTDGVVVYAKSGVFKSLKHGTSYSGIPAREHSAALKAMARLYREIRAAE